MMRNTFKNTNYIVLIIIIDLFSQCFVLKNIFFNLEKIVRIMPVKIIT